MWGESFSQIFKTARIKIKMTLSNFRNLSLRWEDGRLLLKLEWEGGWQFLR